jgi:thiosulfate/3-mercaptopyruvate sulfurtransferase
MNPLISTDELHEMLPARRVVDATWYLNGPPGRQRYEEAHVPGAVFFDLEDIVDSASPLPHMLPTPDVFAREAGSLGVAQDDQIVVYHHDGIGSAARVWWTFRVFGAPKVQVLNGGLRKWRAEGRPVETGDFRAPPTTFHPWFRPGLVKAFDDVRRALAEGSAQVVDARSQGRFLGQAPEPRAGVRGGRMPRSHNLPFERLISEDGTLRDRYGLEAAFRESGVDPSKPVITTCGSGVTAAILALGLAVLGHDETPVYDGSWAEWGSREDAEVVSGPLG